MNYFLEAFKRLHFSSTTKISAQRNATDRYPKRTEQNVIDPDGTLIISHRGLSGGSEYTRKMAEKHGKPWMHVDASRMSVDVAVELIRAWINGRKPLTLFWLGNRLELLIVTFTHPAATEPCRRRLNIHDILHRFCA